MSAIAKLRSHAVNFACAVALASGSVLAAAQQPPSAKKAAKPAAAPTESQARARELLIKMSRFLGSAQRFSVNVRAGYDAVQQSGEKIEFAEIRKATVSRPSRLRVEGERSDGARVQMVFTGKEIVLVDGASNVFATAPQPGDLDRTIVHFVKDLGLRLPLAALFLTSLPAELESRVGGAIDYVERTSIYGAPAHHLAARTATVDFQIWIADAELPLPQRVVITYKLAPGQPQYRALLSDWNLAPDVSDAVFALKPPEGAQKVTFAAQLPRLTMAARTAKRQGGTK